MQWHDWSEDAFELARENDFKVLLFLRASWCRWCREIESETLSNPDVIRILSERFVCVRVDKDRRPDIDARYRKGGWPTLSILDHNGDIETQVNHVVAEELIQLLTASDHGSEPRPQQERRTPSAEPAGTLPVQSSSSLSLDLVEDIRRTLLDSADPVHGGWGTRHKFPHPEALHFLVVRWAQTGDQETLDAVLRTLHKMQAGEIYDRVEGGFYRYATQPDWSVPHHEKMLDSNANRLMAYVECYQALGEQSFKETALGILSWMQETLLDPTTGAFKNSQDADPAYAHLPNRKARASHGSPACDPTIFTNYNANAATALLKSSVVLGDSSLRDRALGVLEFLMEDMWNDQEGMYHYWDGTYNLPGMLTDQAATLRALVEAAHYAGENCWIQRAEQLAHITIEHLQTADGSFMDTRHDPRAMGWLRHKNTSILDNATMAEALLRLGHMTYDQGLQDKGKEVLNAFLKSYKRYGHHVAGYGRVVDLLIHPPVHVTIVGPKNADHTHTLRLAALRPYVPSRVVQVIDPIEDEELFTMSGLPNPAPELVARAYVDRGHESYAETSKPERLPVLMVRTERSN